MEGEMLHGEWREIDKNRASVFEHLSRLEK
jgi:hypothetical protein